MTVLEIIFGILLIIASIVMIIVIILQEGNQQGVGVVSGGADTFFSKNKARSYDAFLGRATKWFAIGFVIVILVLNIVAFTTSKNTDNTKLPDTATSDTADEVPTIAATEATPQEG